MSRRATGDRWLRFVLAAGVGTWVGGATTLQALMARARAGGDRRPEDVVRLADDILWSIRHLFIPVGGAGVAAGIALAARSGVPFRAPWVAAPLALYAALIALGSSWSLPEYERLLRRAAEHGPDDPELLDRLDVAAWVNRVELALVLAAIGGILARAGGDGGR